MRTADLITSACILVAGGVVLYDATRLGFGWGEEGPRSGFFPFWLAVSLIAVSAAVFVQAWRRQSVKEFVTPERFLPVLKVVLPVAGFIFLIDLPGRLPGLGLYVAGALYMGVYMRWVGHHRWLTVVLVPILVVVVAFVIFEDWFLVPMPKGPLEAWLGY